MQKKEEEEEKNRRDGTEEIIEIPLDTWLI